MILILSPTKIFRTYQKEELLAYKPLKFREQTHQLVERLKQYTREEIASLMKVSDEIASSNYERFQAFDEKEQKGYYAADYFYGEAFKGLEAPTLSQEGRVYMEKHLKILSGLYGLLDAKDIMVPYRLEMGTKFSKEKGDHLYAVWKSLLTEEIKLLLEHAEGEKVLINLASEEYTKALDLKEVAKSFPIITLHFKVKKGDEYKVVGMYAKKARGMMTRYICENKIQNIQDIKSFQEDDYQYDEQLSTSTDWVFVKK